MSPNGTLHMDTEAVRKMALNLGKFSTNIGSFYDEVGRATASIIWKGPAADDFMGKIGTWAYGIPKHAEIASALSRMLYAEADEWEEAAASLAAATLVPTYVHPENANSTDPSRISDIESYLTKTPYGQELLKLFEDYDVTIEFGTTSNPNAIAETSPDGKHIVINEKYANLTDAELAAILVHEGTHAKQGSLPAEQWPVIGWAIDLGHMAFDGINYLVYPWDAEYESFRAMAEFWQAVGTGQPDSSLMNWTEEMIFMPDGSYREFSEACGYFHDAYSTHLIDAIPTQ